MLYNNERPTGQKQQLCDGKTVENKGKLILTDPFLTTFYYVEKLNAILRKNKGERFEILRTLTWV